MGNKSIISKIIEDMILHEEPRKEHVCFYGTDSPLHFAIQATVEASAIRNTIPYFISPIQNHDEWGNVKMDYNNQPIFDGRKAKRFIVDELSMWPQIFDEPVIIPYWKSWPLIIQYAIKGTPYHQNKIEEIKDKNNNIIHKPRALGPTIKKQKK